MNFTFVIVFKPFQAISVFFCTIIEIFDLVLVAKCILATRNTVALFFRSSNVNVSSLRFMRSLLSSSKWIFSETVEQSGEEEQSGNRVSRVASKKRGEFASHLTNKDPQFLQKFWVGYSRPAHPALLFLIS